MKFANRPITWLNIVMRNLDLNIQKKNDTKYLDKDFQNNQPKTSNINVLLNRIQLNKKIESKKKIYFFGFTSAGLLLFGLLIF